MTRTLLPTVFDRESTISFVEGLEGGGISLWQYSEKDQKITFFGKSCILRFFGCDEFSATFSWKAYLNESVHPDDRAHLVNSFLRSATDRTSFLSRYRIREFESGDWCRIEAFGKTERREDGTVMISGGFREVTEYVRTSQGKHFLGISRADERMRIMSDATPLACNFWDEHYRVIDCNLAAVKMFGMHSKREYLERYKEFSPEYQPDGKRSSVVATEKIAEAFQNGGAVFEWMHQKPNGELIPVKVTLVRVKQGDGYIVVGYAGDLRELKKTLSERREADERMQIMLDATPLCCNFWDENFNNIDCNLAAPKLFGLRDKQEYLDRFNELSPEYQPNGRLSDELALENIRKAFRDGQTVFEWMHQKPNGEPIPSEITLVRVKQANRYIVVGYTRDLRELKQTQSALDQERLLLLNVLHSSPVCFAILVGGSVRFVTPFMHDFLGIEVGERLVDFFADRSPGEELLRDLLTQNRVVNWRPISLRTKHGELKEMLASMFTTDYYGEEGVMLWLIDVTQIRKVEADLILARDAAEASARTKSEFLANMSHEIRTPMNAILGMTHLVLHTDLTPKQRGYIENTEQSTKLLLRIINDILDFSKIEAGKMVMENTPFSLRSVVESLLVVVKEPAEKKGLTLQIDIAPGIPERMIGDPGRLHQVLLNLLNNAIKFTSEGGVEMTIDLLESREHVLMLRFAVRDTGIGLSPEQIRALFVPFTQGDASTTRKYGGTGLGLAICRSLVDLMQGEIRCESRVNEGAVFTFTARFESAEAESTAPAFLEEESPERSSSVVKKTTAPPQENERMASPWILLAEDNKINQLVAMELLQIKGYRVDIADNGRQAIAMLEKNDYSLVLMDIQMPEMDGLQATQQIRSNPKFASLPIIAMTAHAMSGDRELSLEAGMNDHITKPIDPVVLYDTLARWIQTG